MDASVYQNTTQCNVYVLLNRDTSSPDIENQIDISSNCFKPINEVHFDIETFNCVICYEDFSMQQLYSCNRCNECKLCLKCTIKVIDKCPVCQKNKEWCKTPSGKIIKKRKIKKNTSTVRETNIVRSRNTYSSCYTMFLLIVFVTVGYLWLKQESYN